MLLFRQEKVGTFTSALSASIGCSGTILQTYIQTGTCGIDVLRIYYMNR